MEQSKDIYILDTSALLTYIEDESGADEVENLLVRAEKGEVDIYVSFISLTEIFYITLQERGEAEAAERIKLLQSLVIKFEESYEALNLDAGRLKAVNRISLADSFIAALCLAHDGLLVHKDPEFEGMSTPVKDLKLPYKRNG